VVAMLEAEAGVFSVPSKVLSYMSAGKPTVLSAPKDNLSTRLVEDNRAGRAVPPGETDEFVLAVSRLIDSEIEREAAGQNALRYAKNAFEITAICEKFEALAISASQARRL
jgi:colanic acid biosynthesis glycosyl transferase WcaI